MNEMGDVRAKVWVRRCDAVAGPFVTTAPPTGRTNSEYDILAVVPLRICTVTFRGVSGIRHSLDVEAETLYEAAVMAVARFRKDIWGEAIVSGTALEVEVREPSAKHSLTLQQVEQWLARSGTPYESSKKAKLKMMLVKS
jgi:hypothetical protein